MKIGDLEIKIPIIQGGMAIKASMSTLAAAVCNEGGIGVIAATGITTLLLKEEIKKAQDNIKNKTGALGVNIMFAATNFTEQVKASIDSGIDVIITGAGFSRDIFELVKGTNVKVFPIVSSVKLAKLAEKLGASALVVEGGNAGGHLGTDKDSWDIVADIVAAVKIPIFGAGGIITPEDGKRMLDLGASGIQMGSRFIATLECEVSNKFKEAYLKIKKGDVVKIMSSAGLPANTIKNSIAKLILSEDESIKSNQCDQCLKHCNQSFCVKKRLILGHEGDLENGLLFAGRDAWRINSILSVKEVFENFKIIF